MNLNAIVAGAVAAINPQKLLTVQVSSGYVTNPDGSRGPAYNPAVQVWGQIQPLQYNDILQIEGMNLQGVRQKIYLNGAIEGLIRGRRMGGDLITEPDGTVWKVVLVTEAWPDWTSAIVTLQD